jgi:TolB-like protein
MKRIGLVFVLVISVTSVLVSCASTSGSYKPLGKNETVIGSVDTTFEAIGAVRYGLFVDGVNQNVKAQAYISLKNEAQKQYKGNIDIRNIKIMWFRSVKHPVSEWSASGDVISLANEANLLIQRGIEGAVYRSSQSLINDLSANSIIAVLSISSKDRDTALSVIEELEFQFVDSKKFKIVDRKTLDAIRTEQNFQLSGDVDDNSAVSIGKMLGANIVITGTISGSSTAQRLTIKALDVKTAQIITMAREQF